MEPTGVFLKEDWDSLNKMFTSNEEADFALQFFQCPNGEANANEAGFDQETLLYSSENFNTNFYLSQESANSTTSASNYGVCFPTQIHENSHFCDSNLNTMMNDNFYIMDGQINTLTQFFPNHHAMQDVICLKEEMGNIDSLGNAENTDLGLKRKFEVPQQPETFEDHPKKKSRVPRDLPKDKRNIVQPKKNQKLIQNVSTDEESTYGGPNGQSSSSYCSEDDSNASQELNGGATSDSTGSAALNSSGKPRAGRGAATDPQSLYARKRRERINERLRILQSIVPNGTKVDISTMLEEAVHYVKFLQLQIKLLSSDDMWMYAPIAYNGMDMGLYQKISDQTQLS